MSTLRLTLTAGAAALAISSAGCSADAPPYVLDCTTGGGQGAPSTCLTPHQTPEYYAQQANKYFDTLDTSADPASVPSYSELVARWEWPPWLKLTGYTRQTMIDTDAIVKKGTPSTVPTRDCRGFAVQPFARCYVSFKYDGGPCAIYEEFTFNDQGEMTFIEAWTASPTSTPWAASDRWAEGNGVHRLSTKVPGLGSPTGRIDLTSPWMQDAVAHDADVADFVPRAQDFWGTWFQALQDAPQDIYAVGCGW
jgi:hypothetical protein